MDDFTRGYILAALWSTNDESDESGGAPMDDNYSPDDIAPEALQAITRDCEAFQTTYAKDLESYYEERGTLVCPDGTYSAMECAGHDFWLNRVGHGVGFWDRGLGALGDRLSDASKKAGELWPYIGDDSQVWGFGE